MKICYIHQYFVTPDDNGGTRSYEFARRLAAWGHEVHVITGRKPTTISRHERSSIRGRRPSIHAVGVEYSNYYTPLRRMLAFLVFAWRSTKLTLHLRPDIVFASSTPLTVALPALMARYLYNVRVIFEVRDVWPEVPIALGELRSGLGKLLARILERAAYSASTAVVALSPDMAASIANTGYPRERIEVIPNSADNELFRARIEEPTVWTKFKSRYPFDHYIVYAGTLGRVNNVKYLSDLAAHLDPVADSVAVVVIGDGREKQALIDSASRNGSLNRNLFLLRPVPKRQMPAILVDAAFGISTVLPISALDANSANKVFDYLAAGVPVLVNHGGWLKEVLETSGAGVALPRTDTSAAAESISKILANPRGVQQMGVAASALADERFSRDELAARLRSVFQRVENVRQTRRTALRRFCSLLSMAGTPDRDDNAS